MGGGHRKVSTAPNKILLLLIITFPATVSGHADNVVEYLLSTRISLLTQTIFEPSADNKTPPIYFFSK